MKRFISFALQKNRMEYRTMICVVLFSIVAAIFICTTPFTEAHGATITARSCSHPDVSNAVSSATRGDTVIVPEGTCTWSSEVNIDKAIKIKGAGIDLTTIKSNLPIPSGTYSGYWLFKYESSSPSSDANVEFEVTGFTLDSAYRAGAIAVRNLSAAAINKIKIHGNKFLRCNGGEGSGTAYTNTLMFEGTVYGVVYDNSFYGLPHFDNYGYTAAKGGINTWNGVTWHPGTQKAIYYEDNIIYKDVSGNEMHTYFSGDKGAVYVARYNTFTNSYNGMQIWNMHSIQRGGTPTSPTWVTYAAMGAELYGNKVTNTVSGTMLWNQGGGRLLAFYNYIDNGSGRTTSAVTSNPHAEKYAPTNHKCNDSTSYACSSDGESQIVRKSYYFNNKKSSDRGSISFKELYLSSWNEWGGNKLAENVNYFLDNTNCTASSCSYGVGCGSSIPTGSCTTGVGYWKTDQSCSSLTAGSYGRNPSIPISGTLYRCTSTNTWAAYYTPYTYPHPLREGELEGVSAPKGFKLVN